jgi:hypothetical protein
MKKGYQVSSKTKVATLLLLLIVAVLLTNMLDRKNYAHLDKSIASIYKDRLMPATYLFELTNKLYQKQLQQNLLQPALNASVEQTIKAYDATYLTSIEKEHWNMFKHQWQDLLAAEEQNSTNVDASRFNAMHQTLQQLIKIQASEGRNLQKESQSLIGFTSVQSHLQISILIILGIFAMVLVVGGSNNNAITPGNKIWMN